MKCIPPSSYHQGECSRDHITNLYFGSEASQTFFDILETQLPPISAITKRTGIDWGRRPSGLFFSEPFMDEISGSPIVSITYPVYVDGSFKGILGIDVNLESIGAIVSSVELAEGSYPILRAGRHLPASL